MTKSERRETRATKKRNKAELANNRKVVWLQMYARDARNSRRFAGKAV